MRDDSAIAEERYQRQFVQSNPWRDATAHLADDPLKVCKLELWDRPECLIPSSSSSGAAPASVPEDEITKFIGIISPYSEHMQVANRTILHSLLRPVEGLYINILNFDGYDNLGTSATVCEYLHTHTNTFIWFFNAALFRYQRNLIDSIYKHYGLNYTAIDQATRAYLKFLKSTSPNQQHI